MPPAYTMQDLHFPKAGLHAAGPFGRQPVRQGRDGVYVRTAAEGVNVRSYESLSLRDRGGSRFGMSRYVAERVPSARWVIQDLATLPTTQGTLVSVQTSASGRVIYLVAVSQGLVKVATAGATSWTATTNNSGENPPLNITGVMQSTSLNQKLYFADGTNYVFYNPPTNSVEAWTPSLGQLPRDYLDNGARLASTWRGRVVLSGLLKDPQNWFMSRIGDALDWEYDPAVTTVADPVAGNNSPLGLVGDVVNGIVPITDDVLVFLGDHTIYAMRGDPAGGGSIDCVSNVTGGAFGKAWCQDPFGNFYFFGSRPSVWRIPAGSHRPERFSQPIEPLLKDINTGTNIITMAWNDRQQAVHVFVTPSDLGSDNLPQATTHYVWEYRANAWWQDVYANADHNPLCNCEYDGNSADDRCVLLGGWDGYVRQLDPAASDDDGTPIASSVLLGPILTQELDEMLLSELQWVLADTSGAVTWEVLAGRTAETAVAAAARAGGTAAAGRNPTQPIRVAEHALYVRITATTRWAMETLRAKFAGRGKVRRRN